MRFLLLHIILLTGTVQLHAQINLVPNPGFEEKNSCPNGNDFFSIDTSEYIFDAVKNWFTPFLKSTPDYHNTCIIPPSYLGLPKSTFGNQMSNHGNAYVGFGTGVVHKVKFSEYLSCRLKLSVVAMVDYQMVFFISLGENYNPVALKTISVGFTKHKPVYNVPNSDRIYDSTYHLVDFKSTNYYDDTANWMELSRMFRVDKAFNYITIGCYEVEPEHKIIWRNSDSVFTTYYFLDDVSIEIVNVDAGNYIDTTICRGRSLVYHKRPDWDSCIWYDGSSDSSKVFTQSGVYWVTHFYAGFTATDTIKLTITDSLPVQTYYLGYCVGDSVLLTARTAQQYIWNNSSTQQTQVVKQAATYYVTGNTLGCLTTDTFHVSEHTLPTITGLKDTVVCFDDIKKIELDAGLHNTYLWQPTGETTRTIYSTMAMLYNLTVTDTNGCKSSQQVAVNEQCNLQLYVPNAFSPNNDGVNEIFKISINPNHIKQFEVYNRWGQLIVQNQTGTWDGKDAPQGVYVIILYYINDNGQEQRYSGNVTLMR